jgi:hypothetical protein
VHVSARELRVVDVVRAKGRHELLSRRRVVVALYSHEPRTRRCADAARMACSRSSARMHPWMCDLLSTYTTVATASPQNVAGRPLALSMHHAAPTTVWFLRSTTPFCAGEYSTVSCCCTPSSVRYSLKWFTVNSPLDRYAGHVIACHSSARPPLGHS